MAQTSRINAILGDLVECFANSAGDTSSKKLKQSKDVTAKQAKAHQYLRTNQFEVESTLAGWIEKFSVVNRDDLADALSKRLDELRSVSKSKWTPELLSLFLNLSDRPDQKSTLEALELLKPPSPLPSPVTWEELNAEEPLTGDVWLDESYSSASEDGVEEYDNREKDVGLKSSSSEPIEGEPLPVTTETIATDDFVSLRAAQFWTQADLRSSRPQLLTELQVIREALHMLHGLPTSVFAIDEENTLVYHATNIMISQIGLSGLNNILQSFASIGSDMLRLRLWSQKAQSVPLLQAFNSAICNRLRDFDHMLAVIELKFTQPQSAVVVSILQVHHEIESFSRPMSVLSTLARGVPDHGGDFICLELLYSQLCSLQAAGDEECCITLGQIFFECLNVYLRPVALWMDQGIILENDESFFISVADKGSASSTLWHDRFTLRMTNDGTLHAPRFLHPAVNKILNAGKSIVFLQHMREDLQPVGQSSAPDLTYNLVIGDQSLMPTLLPFSELFTAAFTSWIGSKYSPASSVLKHQLFAKCNLLQHIDTLEHVYFSRDGVLFQTFADELFKRMDNQRRDWNDKFLLSELARRTFGSVLNVAKAGTLSVRTGLTKPFAQSLKAFSAIVLDYNLPWAVQNIIQRSSMSVYQSVFSLLLQIYRAKYLLRADSYNLRTAGSSSMSRLRIGIRQRLVWFANIMHSYVTETVVQPAMENLREKLTGAENMDEMCEVHVQFVKRLELCCLVAKNLAPIHDSIISILDLAVVYSAMQITDPNKVSLKKHSYKSSFKQKDFPRGRMRNRPNQEGDNALAENSSASGTESSDDDMDEQDEVEEGENPKEPYDQRLQTIHDQFSQHLHFTVAGLRGVSRAGGEPAWEMLADSLDWGSGRRTQRNAYG